MKRLTHTGQLPAGQSTRRFPRAKSDRQQRSALTYLSPRHQESPPREFHVPDGRRRGCEKATGAAALLAIFPSRYRSRTLSSRTPFPLSFSLRWSVSQTVRPSVRPPVARSLRSLLHSSPDRALHSGDGGGGQTTHVLSNASPLAARCRYICDTRHFRLTPCLATTPYSSPRTNAGDTHGRFVHESSHTLRAARTHNARTRFVMAIFGGKQLRAPTARRGSLRRPASGTSLRSSGAGAPFSTAGVATFPSHSGRRAFLPFCETSHCQRWPALHSAVNLHPREVESRASYSAAFTRYACPRTMSRSAVTWGDLPPRRPCCTYSLAGSSTPARL